jgi:hypothetical protein
MTEQSTSPLTMLENKIGEIKKSFALSILLLMATGNSGPQQLDSPINANNRTHLIYRKEDKLNTSSMSLVTVVLVEHTE